MAPGRIDPWGFGKGGLRVAEITFEDVTKVYGEDVVAVNEMNLDIPDGEFVVFVGPSGCGKSTALRMVAGLEDISRGVEDAAKILGLENFLDRKPRALSGGQRQRVALGRAIVRNPQAFLMDEPLSNLDAKLRVQMRTEIAKLHNRIGTTTIYVTHDQTEAMTMADRIVLLKDGEAQQIAPPQQMYDHPNNIFVAGFIGSPAMNLVQDRKERDDGSLAAVFGQTRIPIPRELQESAEDLERFVDGDVVLGIRPEHFEDVELAETTEGTTPLDAEPQVIESMGNEKYVYFGLPKGGEAAHTQSIDEMESEIGTGGDEAGGPPVT